jgi:hypothetical protein
MRSSESSRKHGADPPKNESGTTGILTSVFPWSIRSVSCGTGFCIAAKKFFQMMRNFNVDKVD